MYDIKPEVGQVPELRELRDNRERKEFERAKSGHIARNQRNFDHLWVNGGCSGGSNREGVEVRRMIELEEGPKGCDAGFFEVTP